MTTRKAAIACVLALLTTWPCAAQQSRFAPVAVDSDVSTDGAVDADGNTTSNIILDAVGSVRIADHLEAVVRPFLQRSATGDWNWQVWVAEVRYERAGRVGVRIDGGLIPSPVGYANLFLRPHLNPTIAQPASLFQPLPQVQAGAPRATLLGAVYANGGSVTVSGAHWDARAALIDTSPLRSRRTFGTYLNNPPRFANVVVGAGVTPFVGFRVGASVTHGGWLKDYENPTIDYGGSYGPAYSPVPRRDYNATVVNIESDFSYRYTQLGGEWTRDSIETSGGTAVASGWFVQGRQTLAPRWFASGRLERISAPTSPLAGSRVTQQLTGFEEVLGFRVTREITIRAGHRARETFGTTGYDHAAEVSIVWWRRWM